MRHYVEAAVFLVGANAETLTANEAAKKTLAEVAVMKAEANELLARAANTNRIYLCAVAASFGWRRARLCPQKSRGLGNNT